MHKAHKEELESVLYVLEKILIFCPEIISSRWQCHSIARILAKLLHPGNSWKLRKEATRWVHIRVPCISEYLLVYKNTYPACILEYPTCILEFQR